MKRKLRKIPYLIVLILISIAACIVLYFLVDKVLNGSFVDWFEWNFMQTRNAYLPEAGQEAIIREPMWWKVKPLVLGAVIGTVAIGIIIGFFASYFHAKAEKRKSVTNIGKMLRDYMKQESESSDMFPQEYAEIAAQMAEIRTAMLRSEQALRNEAAQKNDLVTYLAHDLKTPLTSVIGYLSLLDEAPDMPPEQKAKYTHIALDKANRLERLVNEFFEITRYNLQQITLEQEQIDLYYMLVQMVDEFYPILSAKGNTAVLHADEDLSVCGDPMKLARVFNNILKNAAAYSFPNSEIIISAEKKDKQKLPLFKSIQHPVVGRYGVLDLKKGADIACIGCHAAVVENLSGIVVCDAVVLNLGGVIDKGGSVAVHLQGNIRRGADVFLTPVGNDFIIEHTVHLNHPKLHPAASTPQYSPWIHNRTRNYNRRAFRRSRRYRPSAAFPLRCLLQRHPQSAGRILYPPSKHPVRRNGPRIHCRSRRLAGKTP